MPLTNYLKERGDAVMILSGGLDSSTLAKALTQEVAIHGNRLYALGFNYGQRHKKELSAAYVIADYLKISYREIDISGIRSLLNSSQTDEKVPVPDGHYAEESMKATVVPNRNAIMLNIALGYAQTLKAKYLVYGAHTGDHAIYPDCRPEFVEAMRQLALVSDYHPVEVIAPFIGMSKADIVALGARIHVPLEKTWSCYKGGNDHCGTCGTCVERIEAFDIAGVEDPTIYEASCEGFAARGFISKLREIGAMPKFDHTRVAA